MASPGLRTVVAGWVVGRLETRKRARVRRKEWKLSNLLIKS